MPVCWHLSQWLHLHRLRDLNPDSNRLIFPAVQHSSNFDFGIFQLKELTAGICRDADGTVETEFSGTLVIEGKNVPVTGGIRLTEPRMFRVSAKNVDLFGLENIDLSSCTARAADHRYDHRRHPAPEPPA